MTWLAWVVVTVLLLLSGTLTAVYDAASQLSASRLRTLLDEGFGGSEALSEVRSKEVAVAASVRLVTHALDLTALGVSAVTAVILWGNLFPVVAVVLGGIVVVLVVSDFLPRIVAARSPVRIALSSASVLLLVTRWTRFLTMPVDRIEDRIVSGNNGESLTTKQRELKEIQKLGEAEGVLEESENRLVERAFRLDELTAWDVMVPRVEIFAWTDGQTLEEIIDALSDVPYSRVPVYHESVDDVTGIVYVREAYERYARGDRQTKLRELAKPPFFVPGSLSLTQLLQDFQVKRIHMGIVADEFGGTDGLVTLEDVLEELVGEIHDETDLEAEDIVRVSPGSVECGAGTDLRDLNEALDIGLPSDEHRSLNGFIMEELGHVPEKGEAFNRDGVRIEILEATETQVVRARLTRLADAVEPAE